MIDLYTAATPNGHKVSIALEELALPYTVHTLKLSDGEQKQPWFLALNPNGRIPAIVDRAEGKIQPAIDRYQGETKRLFRVLDGHLKDREFLAGDYSIADIANWAWVRTHRWSGVELDDLPHLKRC